ncbi:MAG TPA: nickel-type superoxide dismutase maturation protease [Verrucomicrobiae bacterium]|nr:nickel-type superoxide dismutase maturation protease [Verrucomicrobiae bacterium]
MTGRSMEPALSAGDWIVVTGVGRGPRVGEIVLLRDPREPGRLMLKRVAGVADGACTVLGDRPEESTDSRAFGPVPLGNVLGRALFRYAPIGRIGWLW